MARPQRHRPLRAAWWRWRGRMRQRLRQWALARHGADAIELTLSSQRIYIVPTPAGLLFTVMLVTMLAGAMNYNNNLGFALTFLLAGIGIAAIYHTHRNLLGLRIRFLGATTGFAGDTLSARFALANDGSTARDELSLDWGDDSPVIAGVAGRSSRTVLVPFDAPRRGLLPLPPLRISTIAPLGLMRAWSWVQMDAQLLVYPRPVDITNPLPRGNIAAEDGNSRAGEDDFVGLRSWQPGDPPRRIAWRQSARRDALLVREFRGGEAPSCLWIDWEHVAGADTEERIARLARLVLDAGEAGQPWGLALPTRRSGPALGNDHLHLCLRELALFAPAGAPT